MSYLENVFIEGSTGAVLDSAAGTPNAQALTIQGNASGVPIPVDIHDSSGNPLNSDGAGRLEVNVKNSPAVTIFDSFSNSIIASGSNLHVAVQNFPATQPVSIASTVPVSGTVTAVQPTGSNLHVAVDSVPTTTVVQPTGSNLHVDVDNFPATQPVSGTVTAVQPTGSSLHVAVDSMPTTTVVQPVGSSLHVDVDNFPATQQVAGTVTVSGTVTALQSNGSNLHVAVDNFPATQPVSGTLTAVQSTGSSLHVNVDNFPATQPVSAVSLPLPTGAATSALQTTANTDLSAIQTNQTNGTQIVQADSIFNATAPTVASGSQSQQQCDSKGSLYVNEDGRKATYRCVVSGVTPILNPTLSLTGSASKIVRITRVRVSLYDVTGSATPALIQFATFATIAGTNTPQGSRPMDQADAAATASPFLWSAVTSFGGESIIDSFQYQLTTASATTAPVPAPIETIFGGNGAKCPVLNGTSQIFAVLFANGVGTTPKAQIMIEWTEE